MDRFAEVVAICLAIAIILVVVVFDLQNPSYVARPVCEKTRGSWIQVDERCSTTTTGKHTTTRCRPVYHAYPVVAQGARR